MNKYNVMIASEEELAKSANDRKYLPVGTVFCQIEAVNEMIAQARHKDGIFAKKYPQGSWVEPT